MEQNSNFFYHVIFVNENKSVISSSGSSGRVWGRGVRGGRGKKHVIYVATFGGHLVYDLFLQGQGHGPSPPRSATDF